MQGLGMAIMLQVKFSDLSSQEELCGWYYKGNEQLEILYKREVRITG